jgi:hypothetical protein
MGNYTCKTEEVAIQGKYPLKGMITIPEGEAGKLPALLFIAGSGKVDRDGYADKLKFYFNAYTQLSGSINEAGYITLRYDKRGVGKSGGDPIGTGMYDLADDAEACIKYLENRPEVDPKRIILLGHSEGCMLAGVVNARHPIAGMILIGGAAETLEQASARQRKLAIEEMMNAKGLKGALNRLMKIDKLAEKQNAKLMDRIMNSSGDTIKYNFIKMNAKWLREHYSHSVIDDLKKAACPVLAVTGDKDSQADSERLKKIPELLPGRGEYRIIKDMDHSLKIHEGKLSVTDAIKQYKQSENQPVHPELKKAVLDWLADKFGVNL